jgi:hypothetical protein
MGCAWRFEPAYKEPQPTIQQEYHTECNNGILFQVNYEGTIWMVLHGDDGQEITCDN